MPRSKNRNAFQDKYKEMNADEGDKKMTDHKNGKILGKELEVYCMITALLLFVSAFLFASPMEIIDGMKKIILSRDALITDYFELAGYGAGFFNAGLMMLVSICMIRSVRLPYTGLTLAVIFISVGFGFWGKNLVNSFPIILGSWFYSKAHKSHFARYVYTALFATCLAPFVTELVYLLPFSIRINIIIAFVIGVFIGYVIPPLSMHTASMHMGYNLFNVGFAAGTLAFVMYCLLKAIGIQSEAVFIWKAERNPIIMAVLTIYFIGTFFWGIYLEHGDIHGLRDIMDHPGRAVADFVMMEGSGKTLMNMGVMGILAEIYLIFINGDLSGPILGCILTVFGFSAFGAHIRNYLPVLTGVALSAVFTQQTLNTPGILIASFFVVGLSPIAGQFGTGAGIIAGLIHAAVVMCTSQMYGGLNLYNNGFSCGWVAIVMLPIMESFMKHYQYRKEDRKNGKYKKLLVHLKRRMEEWFMKKRK